MFDLSVLQLDPSAELLGHTTLLLLLLPLLASTLLAIPAEGLELLSA